MRVRDAFLFKGSGPRMHLAVVVTDPAKRGGVCVVAIFSTWKDYKEQTCVVEAGCHEFFKEKTVVEYEHTKVMAASGIDGFLQSGRYKPKDPVSADLYDRVCDGFKTSTETPIGAKQILAELGFL